MKSDCADPIQRWQAIVDFYADFAGMPGWEFLRPMIDLTEWIKNQSWAGQLFPGTSHEWLCVSCAPDRFAWSPFFSVCSLSNGSFRFQLRAEVGSRPRFSQDCTIADGKKVFEQFADRLPRCIHINDSWLTSTVTNLATSISAENAFGRLPILADALEDAGCDNADILNHCRQPREHVRGCWVVDLVLGKS
jgi:hypothetical protein